ncbi:MAG: hypothetical protein IJU24_06070 [Bacteroidaceae bacterium]|nr:hypothetical protein [Bacteroidaceae bacterium]
MEKVFAKILLSASLVPMLVSCSGKKGEYLSLPVKEVDYLGKCGPALSGTPVSWSPLGCDDFVIKDSLCMIVTSDPDGMLKVVSLNSNSLIGNFCTKGRAGNEFDRMVDIMNQPYVKDGDILYPLMNFPDMEVKAVNVSESLRKRSTVIDGIIEFEGNKCSLLDNDKNRQFQIQDVNFPEGLENIGDKVPLRYVLVENGVENEINVFPKRMRGADDGLMFAPYGGAIYKHPARNIVVQLMSGINQIIFFDFEKNRHFAIHQKATPSFEDEYPGLGRDEMFFTDAALSDDYLFALYWHEGNEWGTNNPDNRPEILAFDWNGNFLGGCRLAERIACIEYDATRNVIYGLSRSTETIYTYPNPVKR